MQEEKSLTHKKRVLIVGKQLCARGANRVYDLFHFKETGFPEATKEERKKWVLNYDYFEHPEGSHLEKKFLYTQRVAIWIAVPITTFDVVMIQDAKMTAQLVARRFCHHWIPAAFAGFTFLFTATCCSVVRDRDDALNHAVAGYTAMLPYALRNAWVNTHKVKFGPGRVMWMWGPVAAVCFWWLKRQVMRDEPTLMYPPGDYSYGDFWNYKRTFDPHNNERIW